MSSSKLRHPEKRNRVEAPRIRKPDWLRVKAPTSEGYKQTRRIMRDNNLVTVCEEAACPNIGECWSKKHATMMVMGDICTRACGFCNVRTGRPETLDPFEPYRVAQAVKTMMLKHVVITSVDRDDLEDGGSSHIAQTIEAIRKASPGTTIEVLTPDFWRKGDAWETCADARPDVFNHNLETVPRLYPAVRPGSRYYQSLRLLDNVKTRHPRGFTKSGIMVGLGETHLEVQQVMDDLRAADVDFLTIGQYLAPTPKHYPMEAFITPEAFNDYKQMAYARGFLLVSSSPLTRSSYHADEDFARLQEARAQTLRP